MNKQREALKLALEALEQYGTSSLNNEDAYSAAIKTIREALAEPARKPLTDEEFMSLAQQHYLDATWNKRFFEFARAIERAHGIGEA